MGEAAVFPIVEPCGDGGGEEWIVDKLIDEDFFNHHGEGHLFAEPTCLAAVEKIDGDSHGAPVGNGEEQVVEIRAMDAGFLENEDAHDFRDEGSSDDGGEA